MENNQTQLNICPQKEEHYDGYRCRCGCTIKTPHSHFIFGQSCECEKGDQLSIKEIPVTYKTLRNFGRR